MKIINLFFIGVMSIFISCSKTEYEQKRDLENRIIGKTWKQLKKEKNLIPVGEGKSITVGNEFIKLYFQYFKPLTINEARELVVYAAETFFNNLNSNEKLNQLLEKPYPMNWIEIEIFVYNIDFSNIDPPGISIVNFKRNKISYEYKINKNEPNLKKYQIIDQETYEEALEKLKTQEK